MIDEGDECIQHSVRIERCCPIPPCATPSQHLRRVAEILQRNREVEGVLCVPLTPRQVHRKLETSVVQQQEMTRDQVVNAKTRIRQSLTCHRWRECVAQPGVLVHRARQMRVVAGHRVLQSRRYQRMQHTECQPVQAPYFAQRLVRHLARDE